MMSDTMVTLPEAAFVFGENLKTIARSVDEHSLFACRKMQGNRRIRVLSMPDLLYLQVLNEMGELLTPKGRLELHEALLKPQSHHEVEVGHFLLPLDRLRNSVEKRLAALRTLKEGVEGDPEDPVLRGTDIEVYRVSALLNGGSSVADIIQDYPSLTETQVELARDYARAIPKKGRPYPSTSFKRATGELGLDALDELLDDEGPNA
jgi:uncharacterized protein (DUF433 family)